MESSSSRSLPHGSRQVALRAGAGCGRVGSQAEVVKRQRR
jgi:hypothetical protein